MLAHGFRPWPEGNRPSTFPGAATADHLPMRYHFSGIAGAGMNPLARLMCAWGHDVQGSDRSLDQGHNRAIDQQLRALGIALVAQDGNGITAQLDRFIYSAAVEAQTPEQQAAVRLGVARTARPGLLAEIVNAAQPGIAVAGTSGKSTTSAMIHWLLRQAGRDHTVLGGAGLAGDHGGCFQAGSSPQAPVVAEACESDGTLVGYHAGIAAIHNITRDHAELDELRPQFATFASQATVVAVNARCGEAMTLTAGHPRRITYGLLPGCTVSVEVIAPGPHRAQGVVTVAGATFTLDLPQPGAHNLENAAAAIAVGHELGIPPDVAVAALATFPGVHRRFEVIGTTDTGIRVVDDYAHNADKIRAAVTAAQSGCRSLIAIFQPHGYGPARFLRPELAALWPTLLRPQDRLAYLGIYDAGGTVSRDITAEDLCADQPPGLQTHCAPTHAALLPWIADAALPGDTVLLMGARDPRLSALARAIHDLL